MRPTGKQKKDIQYLLRKLVIARDGECCLKCGKTTGLHMSHIYPKGRYRGMEFEPENLKLLCNGCHLFWWHKNPIEAHEWLAEALTPNRLLRLKNMSLGSPGQGFDPKLHILFLQQEIKKLEGATPVR